MLFGERVRALRKAKRLTLRQLAPLVGVGHTYLSRVETGKQTYGEYPSEILIRRLAAALDGDEEELLLLAEKIPERIRRRFFEQPEAFRELAWADDATLNRVLAMIRNEMNNHTTQFPRGSNCCVSQAPSGGLHSEP